jgi:hypothetical protein
MARVHGAEMKRRSSHELSGLALQLAWRLATRKQANLPLRGCRAGGPRLQNTPIAYLQRLNNMRNHQPPRGGHAGPAAGKRPHQPL